MCSRYIIHNTAAWQRTALALGSEDRRARKRSSLSSFYYLRTLAADAVCICACVCVGGVFYTPGTRVLPKTVNGGSTFHHFELSW